MTTYERIMSVIAIPMGWVLTFLYDFINNYGIALIVFTILIRACLFPVYISQIKFG